MSQNWRLILQKDTSAAYGLAVDEVTTLSVARNNSPPVLHLYNFLPCIVLGRYQSAQEAINIEACREHGLEINRRHTGGGTVMMGPTQLALGFSIPKDYPGVGPSINDIFKNLGGILCKALDKIGIKARFRPKNDIEVNKKKIAGLSASLEERDVAFFHTSLLLHFDFKLMLKVFKLPIKKLADKHISCFTDRMTTVRREKHRRVDLPSFQSIVRKAFEEQFDITFRIDTLNQWELDQLDLLLRHRYTNPEWIFSRRHPRVGMGFASAKTPGGLVELGITLSGGVIEAAYLSGDFLSTSTEINQIESALRYCAATKKGVLKRLRGVMGTGTIFKVKRDTIVTLALKAAKEAKVARDKARIKAEKALKEEEEKKQREIEAMRAAYTPPPPQEEEEQPEKATAGKTRKKATKKAKAAKKKAVPVKKKPTAVKKAAAPKKKTAAKKTKPSKKAKPALKKKPAKKAASKKTRTAAKQKPAKKPRLKKTKAAAKKIKPAKKKHKTVRKAAAPKKTAARKAKPSKRPKPAARKTNKAARVKSKASSGKKRKGAKR